MVFFHSETPPRPVAEETCPRKGGTTTGVRFIEGRHHGLELRFGMNPVYLLFVPNYSRFKRTLTWSRRHPAS